MTKNSFRFIRTSAIAFAAAVALCFMSQSANAQGCGYGGYGGGYGGGYRGGVSLGISSGYGGYGGYGRGVNFGYSSYRPSYYTRPVWHDTTHLDYHPGRYVPHGNHLDYVPGHKSVHRTGHWHR